MFPCCNSDKVCLNLLHNYDNLLFQVAFGTILTDFKTVNAKHK